MEPADSSPKHKQRLPIPHTGTEQHENRNLMLIQMSGHNPTKDNLVSKFILLTTERQPYVVYKDPSSPGFHGRSTRSHGRSTGCHGPSTRLHGPSMWCHEPSHGSTGHPHRSRAQIELRVHSVPKGKVRITLTKVYPLSTAKYPNNKDQFWLFQGRSDFT